MMLPRNLDLATQLHLDQLIADRLSEGPHLEFKRELPTTFDDEWKSEFQADVSAFANAGGGDLIFGLCEAGQGHASRIVPQPGNADQITRRLLDILRTGVEPSLIGVQIQPIKVSVDGVEGHVFLLRVPQSWAGPHRIKLNQRFYVREGPRKRLVDVPELRSLFLRSADQARVARDFRSERLGKIMSGEAPHPLVDGPLLTVHIVPTQSALGLVQVDPVQYTQRPLPVLGKSAEPARLNIDGALVVKSYSGGCHGYSQLFRNGFFESTFVLEYKERYQFVLNSLEYYSLYGREYEQDLINLLANFRSELTRLGINSDCAVMLSLLRADEVRLMTQSRFAYGPTHFDRKTLILPDVIALEDNTPGQALKPAFDLMWQAAGLTGSPNYVDGEWCVSR